MHLKEKPSNLSTDGESRSLSEANLVTKPKAELPNLFARRPEGNGRVRGSQKSRPLSIVDFCLLRTHVVLVQASVSSLHRD